MSIDLKTASVEPIRRTFDHIEAKLGDKKAPTRYQEAVWGLQPALNFHYRPTWDPARELYDPSRTAIVMEDFDDLVDPRQYYYGTWTIQRGKQQDSQEKNFEFVEKRQLLATLDDSLRERIETLVIPLRHIAWGANTNNSYIAAYGFGAPLTSACAMHMMDELGVAQYISRIGLLLEGNEATALDAGKGAWLHDPMWQPMRALVEELMVTKDWFELFVVQNLLLDGAVQPLVFDRFEGEIVKQGGAIFSMLSEFMIDWFVESSRWIDAVVKRAVAESDTNKTQIESWVHGWMPRVQGAVQPLAEYAFAERASEVVDAIVDELNTRAGKSGLNI
ncbi:MAG: aromatic/alkene monooxygenase hydroxylase subunit beta [Gammaproteobacteria bacterium]